MIMYIIITIMIFKVTRIKTSLRLLKPVYNKSEYYYNYVYKLVFKITRRASKTSLHIY